MSDVGKAFHALHAREWAWRREQFAGYDTEDSTGEPAAHLPRVDVETQLMREEYWSNVLKALDALALHQLSHDDQLHYQVYRAQIEDLLVDQRFRMWEMPFTSDTSFWSDLGFSARAAFFDEAHYERYLGQLEDIPRYFDEHIVNMRAGLSRGFSVAQSTLGELSKMIAEVADTPAPRNLFYTPFVTMPAGISADRQAQLRSRAIELVWQAVQPAYARLLAFLGNEYIPQARPALAARELPDGEAFYQSRIRKYTTLDLSADAVHALGLKEVARLRADMQTCIDETGFAGDFKAFLDYLRNDPAFYAETAEQLLKEAAWIAKRVDGKIGQYIGHLPRQPFAIEPVPADLAPYYTSGRGGPGLYLLNTWKLSSRPLYSLPALTLHEASPGHALQMPLAAELEDLPDFRRYNYLSAYGEGWALYAERLGLEMGIYDTPYARFGYLNYQIWRACRLIVDTGLHHLGWTRAQAEACLRENTALSEHEIATEVNRYIAWPGQALSYYIGQTSIVDARAKAELALGPSFDLRAFHDTVLSLGSVPLPVLQQRVERFIAEGGPSPYANRPLALAS